MTPEILKPSPTHVWRINKSTNVVSCKYCGAILNDEKSKKRCKTFSRY